MALAGLEDDHLGVGFRLDLGLEGLGVGLDRRERVVVHRDHGRGADELLGGGGFGAVLWVTLLACAVLAIIGVWARSRAY